MGSSRGALGHALAGRLALSLPMLSRSEPSLTLLAGHCSSLARRPCAVFSCVSALDRLHTAIHCQPQGPLLPWLPPTLLPASAKLQLRLRPGPPAHSPCLATTLLSACDGTLLLACKPISSCVSALDRLHTSLALSATNTHRCHGCHPYCCLQVHIFSRFSVLDCLHQVPALLVACNDDFLWPASASQAASQPWHACTRPHTVSHRQPPRLLPIRAYFQLCLNRDTRAHSDSYAAVVACCVSALAHLHEASPSATDTWLSAFLCIFSCVSAWGRQHTGSHH